MVFDKTGTLTEHGAGIQRVTALGTRTADEALAIAAALESRSEHPIARAFPRPDQPLPVTDVAAVPGYGLQGQVDGERFRIGTAAFAGGLLERGISTASAAGDDSEVQAVYLGGAQGLLARFDIAEHVRAGVDGVLAALARQGIRIAIASGDRPGPVRAVARRLGVQTVHAELRPEDKLALVRRLQDEGRVVTMVGDGINDSPVLAGADVSIAVGGGTSLAQHAADCILIGPDLGALPQSVAVARHTMRIVRQNLAWAIAYNVIAVPLAALGMLAPWVAALGMSASSLLVTFNALRLGRPQHAPVAGPLPAAARTAPAA
jgi:Cu2+-exporting ATPase